MTHMKKILSSLVVVGLIGLSGCATQDTATTTSATTTHSATVGNNPNVKIINGKRYVYIAPHLGSNMPARWVPEDSAEAAEFRHVNVADASAVQAWQDRSATPLQEGVRPDHQ